MANSKTTLKKGDNLPARGRSVKTIILEAIRENSHLDLTPESTKDEAEKAAWQNLNDMFIILNYPNANNSESLTEDQDSPINSNPVVFSDYPSENDTSSFGSFSGPQEDPEVKPNRKRLT